MIVKIKKINDRAVIPCYKKPGDAGMDLVATSFKIDEDGNLVYGTGLAFEIPEGYVGLIFPRSSIAEKDIYLTNCVGVIDSGYRGEVKCKFKPSHFAEHGANDNLIINNDGILMTDRIYRVGERVCQIVIIPYPHIEFEEVDELSTTERGEGGYGSTGM